MFLFFVSEDQLLQIIFDLFAAGTDTITNTLLFSVIFMLHHPDIRVKVQQEIDEQLGRETPPFMADMIRMPLVQATLLEIQRLADVVPLAVPHTTLEDTEFMGYRLPQGTTVMPNLYAVHRYRSFCAFVFLVHCCVCWHVLKDLDLWQVKKSKFGALSLCPLQVFVVKTGKNL